MVWFNLCTCMDIAVFFVSYFGGGASEADSEGQELETHSVMAA